MLGLDTALGELTLVFFTTLAPPGTLAYMIMAIIVLFGRMGEKRRKRIKQFLCIPLITAMVGLVASATHLGNPANALYVFMGVGRSPLSNEVFCAALFLGLAASYWLYSFTETSRPLLERIWLLLAVIAGVAFITSIAFAYSVDTIISWYSPYVPLSLWLCAGVGGPPLALLSLHMADSLSGHQRFMRRTCAATGSIAAIHVVVLFLYNNELMNMRNSIVSADDLLASYTAVIIAYTLLVMIGLAAIMRTLHVLKNTASLSETDDKKNDRRLFLGLLSGCLCIFAGIFIIRFAFYMLHMTVGLSV
jgi:anaerobic dimethyl sulfoxide reductase subunit C